MKRCGDIITALTEYRQEKNNSGLSLAVKHCSNIEELVTTVRTKEDDKNTSHLLAVNKKLRILSLVIQFKNAKVCFRKTPTDFLEELDLTVDDCKSPSTVILIGEKQVIGRCLSSLKKLSIDYFDDELVELIGQKVTLKSLELRFNHASGVTAIGLYHVLKLKNLRKLDIKATPVYNRRRNRYFPPVTDDFLMTVAENLSLLEVIIIETPTNVTNNGFKSLATLKKLRELRITDCPRITDEFLVLFTGLEKLDVANCDIRDEGVIKLLEQAKTMRHLNLEVTLITNATLVAAVNATKKRDNGICLNLYNAATYTTPMSLTEMSPLLKIIGNNSWEF